MCEKRAFINRISVSNFPIVEKALFAFVILCTAFIFTHSQAKASSFADIVNRATQTSDGIMNSYEFRSTNFSALPQWQRVMQRLQGKDTAFRACLGDARQCTGEHDNIWHGLLAQMRGMSQYDQLVYINSYFNQWPYREDLDIYGVREYWASPKEFMRNSGDCEDFAIAKYFILRHAGFTQEQLRIVAVQDTIRNLGHAVLLVKLPDGQNYVLDNLTDMVLDERRFAHYVPQFSVNETARWTHTPRRPQTHPWVASAN